MAFECERPCLHLSATLWLHVRWMNKGIRLECQGSSFYPSAASVIHGYARLQVSTCGHMPEPHSGNLEFLGFASGKASSLQGGFPIKGENSKHFLRFSVCGLARRFADSHVADVARENRQARLSRPRPPALARIPLAPAPGVCHSGPPGGSYSPFARSGSGEGCRVAPGA